MNNDFFEIGKIYNSDDVASYAKLLYYNVSTNHNLYAIGNTRLRFKRLENDQLEYIGSFLVKEEDDKK